MRKITLSNVRSFIRGHANMYLDKLGRYPEHKQEQILYRLSLCVKDCVPANACKYCSCPPKKKVYDPVSCNKGARFPDMLNEEDWKTYKVKHKIVIKDE